jgi:hypothetical protein
MLAGRGIDDLDQEVVVGPVDAIGLIAGVGDGRRRERQRQRT